MLDQQDLQKIEDVFQKKIDDFAIDVNRGFSDVTDEISTVKHDLSAGVSDVKMELSVVKTEVSSVKSELSVIKFELTDFKETTQKNFELVNERIDKLYNLIDGFIQLHQKLDQELTMLRARVDRLEAEIQALRFKHA